MYKKFDTEVEALRFLDDPRYETRAWYGIVAENGMSAVVKSWDEADEFLQMFGQYHLLSQA
jgi:hypothetical protein